MFISEPIEPLAGSIDVGDARRGLVATPGAFRWRDQTLTVRRVMARTKQSAPEGHKAGNEVYLRRENFTLELTDGRIASVYFTRQATSNTRQRWFLYTIEDAPDGEHHELE